MPHLPSSVSVDIGAGGLGVVRVAAPNASAEIYLHGAHVTSWAPAGHEVLWMSGASRFEAGSAIRGGIPLCFPWFGAHPVVTDAPAHGFARLRTWELVSAAEVESTVVVVLRLTDDESTRDSPWPHPFEARYTVTVGAALTVQLEITNCGDVDAPFEEAMHTYLAVDDVRRTEVRGLEGVPFVDRLVGPVDAETVPVRFAAETDRIYVGTRAPVTVHQETSDRRVRITKEGSDATVVWNPWVAKAQSMKDFGDDEWTGMVCVETCNIREAHVRLPAGKTHTMTAVLTSTP